MPQETLQSVKQDLLKAINDFASDIERRMVTKDYLDRKLANQYSDLVKVMRREDEKIKALI